MQWEGLVKTKTPKSTFPQTQFNFQVAGWQEMKSVKAEVMQEAVFLQASSPMTTPPSRDHPVLGFNVAQPPSELIFLKHYQFSSKV